MAGYKQIKEQWRRQDKKAEALNPATPAMLKRADELGRQGYFAGKKAPAQDAEIIDMCKNRPHNTKIKLMTAWSKGWHNEHMKSTNAELRAKGFYDKPKNSKPWVKVTSVSSVSRVKPGDKNDRSVYFWVNGEFTTRYVATGHVADFIDSIYSLRVTAKPSQTHEMDEQLCHLAQRVIDEISGKTPPGSAAFYETTRYKPTTKPAPNLPPILTAPPELAADVLGTGPMGLTPTAAPKRKPAARTTKPKAKKTPAAKTRKTTKKTAKPKAKKTAATPKLTASQREYLAIQGFVMVKRGGKYVRITG